MDKARKDELNKSYGKLVDACDVDTFNSIRYDVLAIQEILDSYDMPRWVSVKEKEPRLNYSYLFNTKYDGCRIGHFNGEFWMTDGYVKFSANAVTDYYDFQTYWIEKAKEL